MTINWTDERVEMLKKLWADGLSASQIAGELGGVTRNAVIGKVHRLGLSGRAKSPSSAVPRQRKVRTATMRPRMRFAGNTALAPQFDVDYEPEADPIANIVPMGPRVSITQLSEATCRWPFGDPTSEEFAYCGSQAKAGAPAPADRPCVHGARNRARTRSSCVRRNGNRARPDRRSANGTSIPSRS
jgi:GcrA cell cycle regulator